MGVFSASESPTLSARRGKLEGPGSPPLAHTVRECRHRSRLLTSGAGYFQKLHIFMQLVMEGGSSEGDEDDRENEEVDAERVETKTSVRRKKKTLIDCGREEQYRGG